MRLVTKEILNQAELVDPTKHRGVVEGAWLIVKGGRKVAFEEIERVKGGIVFRNPDEGDALLMLDEEALIGIEVRLAPAAGATHEIRTLPDLLAWAAKRQKA